jgi:hypothetical protein
MYDVKNKKAKQLLTKIINETEQNSILYNSLADSLKELRKYVVEENIPVIAKVLRLTYQHLEAFEGFLIPIPKDEPFDEYEQTNDNEDAVKGEDSMMYLLNLIKHHENKLNEEEIREYIKYLELFAEDD